MALSNRGHKFSQPDPQYVVWEVLQNLWVPEENPDGYVSLGVAENSMMHATLIEHVHSNISLPEEALTYGDGGKRIKAAIARFLNKHLSPVLPIMPAHITHTNGCSSAIEHLAWALGNPGDAILLGQPYYGTFVSDLTARFDTQLAYVPFHGVDPLGSEAVQKYEDKLLEVQAKGQRVAALVIANPHNPLGRCYPRSVLIELMKLCQRHKVHLISDEIYALSVFENKVDTGIELAPFESISSIDPTGIIDPALVHIVWGMSKDFGANGIRLGAVISQHNPALHAAIVPVSLYTSASSITEHIAANILEDDVWVDEYVRLNQENLAQTYVHVTSWAKAHGIEYAAGANAGFFLWVNLGSAYKTFHPDESGPIDNVVMDALLRHKIFLASGVAFGSEAPGWFRIIFTHRMEYLDEGLRRIITAVELA